VARPFGWRALRGYDRRRPACRRADGRPRPTADGRKYATNVINSRGL